MRYAGRRPGDPAWNASRYAVFRLLAKQIDSAHAQELDRQMLLISDEMSKLNPDRNVAAAAALGQRRWHCASPSGSPPCPTPIVLRLLERIPDEAETVALADERAAEQAAMAMDSLYIAYSRAMKPANAVEVRTAINGLFQQLENPSAYNADRFASAFRRIRSLLQ